MKSRTALCALSLSMAILLPALNGCSNGANESEFGSSSIKTPSSQSSTTIFANSDVNSDYVSESAPYESIGTPTFLIGLDGKAILTSEITRLENTDKTAETLTETDYGADVLCEGFAYLKEPSGITFGSYRNPELFDDYNYLGEPAENKNVWKRVNVGDEICGLKLKSAAAAFEVNYTGYAFPEKYFTGGGTDPHNRIEFEGTIEIEGFLQIMPNNIQYSFDNEKIYFYPCESKLPVTPEAPDNAKGYITPLRNVTVFDNLELGVLGETDCLDLGNLENIVCDLDGVGCGDVAYVKATLGNISLKSRNGTATLENVERIDILTHHDDQKDAQQPALWASAYRKSLFGETLRKMIQTKSALK